jgi:hypothetical protein
MDANTSRATAIAGIAILGAMITGVFALVSALDSGGEARAIELVAAAVAFAGVANAIFRR